MDGQRTVQDIWERVSELAEDDAPTQGNIVDLLGQLHASDALICNIAPDTEELFKRHRKVEMNWWKMNLRSPLALRFPLLDPEKFLRRTIKYAEPFFSLYGLLLWAGIVTAALILAILHWPELTSNIVDRVFTAENLISIWLFYPFIKALHELAHAYAVKKWGGEVHEMGIMLLVLMPLPYVDASAATVLRNKWKRIVVDAAGIIIEVFVAAVALFLWLSLEPGYMRSIAYSIVFIASISTVLFNGNPLLRYDGYYILSDLLEIPNLSQRCTQYVGYLVNRYLFGVKDARAPYIGPGERFWFIAYSIASFMYRLFIYAAIIFFIAGKFFALGFLLAAWACISMIIVPVCKGINYMMENPLVRQKRIRSSLAISIIAIVILGILFVLPFPSWTTTEGVVWVPNESLIRSKTSGFIVSVKVSPGTHIRKGEELIQCEAPLLPAQVDVLKAQLRELQARHDAEVTRDQVQTQMVDEEIKDIRANLKRATERLRALTIRSPGDGVFILPGPAQDLPGRYVQQGSMIGYVLNVNKPTVRTVLPQSDEDQVRHYCKGVAVRLSNDVAEAIPAIIKREVPAATAELPSSALGSVGGGKLPIDPRDRKGLKSIDKLFDFEIELTRPIKRVFIGERVYVRFDLGFEPLGFQGYRALRQLLLRRFNV